MSGQQKGVPRSVQPLLPVEYGAGHVCLAPGVRAGDWIFVSGLMATGPSGVLQPALTDWPLPLRGEPRHKLEAGIILERAHDILEAGGTSFANVLRTDQFYPDWRPVDHFQGQRRRWLGSYIPPSTSILQAELLVLGEGIDVSMMAIAADPNVRIETFFPAELEVPAGAGFTPVVRYAARVDPSSQAVIPVWIRSSRGCWRHEVASPGLCVSGYAGRGGCLAGHNGEAKPIAGGQSLMPMLALRIASPSLLVDLRKLPDLNRITIGDDGVRLGAMVRWRDIEDDARLRSAQPLLAAAIKHVAHYQIRNRGTVGGGLAHADPPAEMPGIALTCDAEIAVMGSVGARTICVQDFFFGPLTTALAADEIITEVRLPDWPARRRWGFQEFSRRRGDFALAGVALFYDEDDDGKAINAHASAIGVGDRPVRLSAVEAALDGHAVDATAIAAAAEAACTEVEPMDDIHAPADYRRALVGTLTERALTAAAAI